MGSEMCIRDRGSILSLVCVALFLLSCYVEGRLQARGEKKEQLAQAAV